MSLLDVRCIARIDPEQTVWLWKDRFPRRVVNLLVGDPGLGKSVLALDLAARFSTGAVMPDGTPGLGQPGHVLLFCAEDDAGRTVRPRLEAAGANLEHVLFATEVLKDDSSEREWFSAQRHFASLESCIGVSDKPWLVIYDPMQAFIGRIDANRDNEVRATLGRFAQLGSKRDVTFLCVMHLNKAVGLPSMYRTGGSIAFPGLARASYLVVKDKEHADRRLVLPLKNNLARSSGGLAFRLEGVEVTGMEGTYPKIDWEQGQIDVDADDALRPPETPHFSALGRACTWLEDRLEAGPVAAKAVIAEAEAAGHAERTINRAKKELRVRSTPNGTGKNRKWFWELTPEDDGNTAKAAGDGDVGGHGGLGDLGGVDASNPGHHGRKGCQECQGSQHRQGGQPSDAGDVDHEECQGSQERQYRQGGHDSDERQAATRGKSAGGIEDELSPEATCHREGPEVNRA